MELQCLKWRIDGVKKGRIKHDDTVPFYAFERDDECKNCRAYSECIKKCGSKDIKIIEEMGARYSSVIAVMTAGMKQIRVLKK